MPLARRSENLAHTHACIKHRLQDLSCLSTRSKPRDFRIQDSSLARNGGNLLCVWFQSLSRSRVVPCHTGTSTFWQPVSKADLGFIKTATDVFDTLKRSRDLGSHGHSDARITRNTSTRKSETASPQEVAQIRKISGLLVPSKCVTLAPGSRVAGCKTVLVSKRRFENFLPLMNSVVYARNDNND